MTAYRESPKVIERVRRVGWAWPAMGAIIGVCFSISLTRIAGCVRESSAREAAEAAKCHDIVLVDNNTSFVDNNTSCPHTRTKCSVTNTIGSFAVVHTSQRRRRRRRDESFQKDL